MQHLKDLAEEIGQGIEQAIGAAEALKGRLDGAVRDMGPVEVAKIGDGYHEALEAGNAVIRTLTDLYRIRDARIQDRLAGLPLYAWAEIERLEDEPEDEDTRGDRLYHEAKDEGRTK